jgi:choline dehydrogenase-like flavoprotein
VHTDGGILETFTSTPELFWASLPLGQMTMRRLKNLATVGIMIRDEGQGTVRFRGDGKIPEITYQLTDRDRRTFIHGARQAVRVYFAAGARAVWPVINVNFAAAKSEAEALAQLPDDLPATSLSPYGSHPQGTARMGADRRNSVCKPTGETHDVERLYVADASLFPSAVGVNPQITILSLATGIARDVAKVG